MQTNEQLIDDVIEEATLRVEYLAAMAGNELTVDENAEPFEDWETIEIEEAA